MVWLAIFFTIMIALQIIVFRRIAQYYDQTHFYPLLILKIYQILILCITIPWLVLNYTNFNLTHPIIYTKFGLYVLSNILLLYLVSFNEKTMNWAYTAHLMLISANIIEDIHILIDKKIFLDFIQVLDIRFTIFLLFTIILMMFYLYQVYLNTEKILKKRRRTIRQAIYVLVSATFFVLLINIYSWEILFIPTFGLNIIILVLYSRTPNAFFFSSGVIFDYFFIDINSGLIVLKHHKSNPIHQSFFATMIIQQKIAETELFPYEFNYGDKKILFEMRKIHQSQILGVVVVNKTNRAFRQSLNYALDSIASMIQSKADLPQLEDYSSIKPKILNIFAYGLEENAI